MKLPGDRRNPARAALAALGEPAHVLQLYLGLQQADGSPVTDAQRDIVRRQVAQRFGAYSTHEGRGRWRDDKTRKLFSEPSEVFTIVRPEAAIKCARLKGTGRNAAKAIALSANQFAVLVVTTCADGKVDSELVQSNRETL